MRAGRDQRRREMADRHRADPALGLRRLARIVDDEGIDHRHRRRAPPRARRIARQRDGLARQPFQRAVRAEMNQRVDALDLAQPDIECDIGVARREVEIVLLALALLAAPAIGLHGDDAACRRARSESEARRRAPPASSADRPRRAFTLLVECLRHRCEARARSRRADKTAGAARESARSDRLGRDGADVVAGARAAPSPIAIDARAAYRGRRRSRRARPWRDSRRGCRRSSARRSAYGVAAPRRAARSATKADAVAAPARAKFA